MAFRPSPAVLPALRKDPDDPRFLELFTDHEEAAHVLVAGVPFDASVLGRKGARHGPQAIREAMRFLASHDPSTGTDLAGLRLHDLGDVAGLRDDVLAAHATVRAALAPVFRKGKPVVLLGGDHGLTFPHVQALADHVRGRIGIVVVDAHYDLRAYHGQPTSGTPFRRILTELEGTPVRGANIAEVGIRPYANTAALAAYAAEQGVRVFPMSEVRAKGAAEVAEEALSAAGDGVDHLWLSIDIDGLDQSIASGCSAPGAGGLLWDEAARIVQTVAEDSRVRGMDLLEVAPELDPTGNTARTAAQLVAAFVGAAWKRSHRSVADAPMRGV